MSGKASQRAGLWQRVQNIQQHADRMPAGDRHEPVAIALPFPSRPKHYRRATKRIERLQQLAGAILTAKIDPHVVRAEADAIKKELVALCHGLCEACKGSMPDDSMMHMHHVVPISRGGTNARNMLALLCPNCHAKAHWIDRNAAQKPANAVELIDALQRSA